MVDFKGFAPENKNRLRGGLFEHNSKTASDQ